MFPDQPPPRRPNPPANHYPVLTEEWRREERLWFVELQRYLIRYGRWSKQIAFRLEGEIRQHERIGAELHRMQLRDHKLGWLSLGGVTRGRFAKKLSRTQWLAIVGIGVLLATALTVFLERTREAGPTQVHSAVFSTPVGGRQE